MEKSDKHISVMLEKAIDYLITKEDGVYIDCTLGRGGFSKLILNKISSKSKLFALDQDITAVEYCKQIEEENSNFKIIHNNFKNIKTLLSFFDIYKVDGIVYDLGVSSPQLDNPERGFSYRFDSKLDMRMDLNQELSAYQVVNNYSVKELTKIIKEYGDEQFAYKIALNIEDKRKANPIKTTYQLVEIIKDSLPQKVKKQKKHPAKKTFQALRIHVNDEINSLKLSLLQALEMLNVNGRIVVITFHSLEEKVVRSVFYNNTVNENEKISKSLPIELENTAKFKLISKKAIKPSNEELENNKRSHSAKMWVLERVKE